MENYSMGWSERSRKMGNNKLVGPVSFVEAWGCTPEVCGIGRSVVFLCNKFNRFTLTHTLFFLYNSEYKIDISSVISNNSARSVVFLVPYTHPAEAFLWITISCVSAGPRPGVPFTQYFCGTLTPGSFHPLFQRYSNPWDPLTPMPLL